MPIAVTYPGVYIQELGSGATPISPVATNIAAFVGRAPFGPLDDVLTCFNYSDFTRAYGGLEFDYPLSYAVQDFFENGGSQAVIARLLEPNVGDGVARLKFPPSPPMSPEGAMPNREGHTSCASTLTLAAANPGRWANFLTASVDTTGITAATVKLIIDGFGFDEGDLFNLTLSLNNGHGKVVATERYLNVTIKDGATGSYANRVDRVLNAQSRLARIEGQLPSTPPGDGASAIGIGGNDGTNLSAATYLGDPAQKTGIYLLDRIPMFNLLCIPPDRRILPGVPDLDLEEAVRAAAARFCADRRALYIVDPLGAWKDDVEQGGTSKINPEDLGITGVNKNGIEVTRNAAVYFPRICKEDRLMNSQPAVFAPCGAVAGVIAANDLARGVWKAPAGTGAGIAGILNFEVALNEEEIAQLNPLGINCLWKLPTIGPVVWGARTLRGADAFEDAYKYVPVRRLTLFIEDSLFQSTQWAVFEPNAEPLWSGLRLQVGSFLADLARQGAFYEYAVKCDATTTTLNDVDRGIVNIIVQFAPVDPAEFVTIEIQQMAGGTPA